MIKVRYLVFILLFLLILYCFSLKTDDQTDHQPIDAVITWVNGKDPNHKKKREYWLNHQSPDQPSVDSNYDYRFDSFEEIKYSVFSILKYLPWIRKIYIVTDNQIPPVHHHPKIRIIDHQDIIPHQYLPTFNSHTIEAHLWRIPNLSRYYLYLNDDNFIKKPLDKGRFLKNGKIQLDFNKIYFYQDKLSVNSNMKGYYLGARNAYRLLQPIFPREKRQHIFHQAVLYDKQVFEKLWKMFPEEFKKTSASKFRSISDISPNILANWYSLETGIAQPSSFKHKLYTLSNKVTPTKLERMKTILKDMELFCLNSISGENEQLMKILLDSYYPEISWKAH